MKKRCALLIVTLIALIVIAAIPAVASDMRPAAPGPPLANMLDAHGTLHLPPGFSGSLDASGWELASRENEPPRFVAALLSARSPESPESAGPAAPRIAGDERWAPGFYPNGVNGFVNAIAVDGSGNVYVGGNFNLAGNLPVRNIAKWDGVGWYALGYGLDGPVRALAWDSIHNWLYVGGYFKNICMSADCGAVNPTRGVARWDPSAGGSWHALAYGVNGGVTALAVDDTGYLYAGGDFPTICSTADCPGGQTVNNIARWNPGGSGGYWDWSALAAAKGVGVSGYHVYALAWWNAPSPVGNVLVVGGQFTSAGGSPVNNLAYWSPSSGTWASFWSGVDGPVEALAVDPSTSSVVVGGNFFDICQIGAVPPNCGTATQVLHIALAIGLSYWGPLGPSGSGVDLQVTSVSIDTLSRNVYVGGDFYRAFTGASVTPVSNIAKWNYTTLPGSWSALGTGTEFGVFAVAWNMWANLLYAGGGFIQAGSVPATGLATWNNSLWSSVGTGNGVGPNVNTVAADGSGRVYVGGRFRAVGNLFVNRIAVWNSNTNSWSALGNGLNGPVFALTLDPSGNLYVGGAFDFFCANADCSSLGQPVNGIAKWTPGGASGTWSGVGMGLRRGIWALALDHDNNLYAGGSFTGICGDVTCSTTSLANHAAIWSGNSWSNLGTGFSSDVRALAVDSSNNLYAGGDFWYFCGNADCTTQGQRVNHIAKWTPGGGGNWSGLGNGLDSSVQALAVDRNNNLYAGGVFHYICDAIGCTGNTQRASGIAKWNGAWSSVGNGFRDYGNVNALFVDDWNNLFAGGDFQDLCGDAGCYAAGAIVNGIAKWDGSSWSGLGSGVGPWPGSYVQALAFSHGVLTVGGYFATAGDKVSANFARNIYGAYIVLPMIQR